MYNSSKRTPHPIYTFKNNLQDKNRLKNMVSQDRKSYAINRALIS